MMRHFYDIGSCRGETFDLYLVPNLATYRNHHVFCFEPSPRHLSDLRRKAEAVCPSFRHGITIIPAAVGRYPGVQRLYEKTTDMSDSFNEKRRINLDTSVVIEVPVIQLSEYLAIHSNDADVTMKLDAEGAEYDVLTDLLASPDVLSRLRTLFVEWHEIDGVPDSERVWLTQSLEGRGVSVQRWMF